MQFPGVARQRRPCSAVRVTTGPGSAHSSRRSIHRGKVQMESTCWHDLAAYDGRSLSSASERLRVMGRASRSRASGQCFRFLGISGLLFGAPSSVSSQSALAAPAAKADSGPLPVAAAQRNVASAGVLRDGVLTLRLVVQRTRWHPEAADGPSVDVDAFGVEGEAPSVPGPLVRVKVGTRVETSIRNALADTLLVYGFSGAGGADTVRIAPGATGHARR